MCSGLGGFDGVRDRQVVAHQRVGEGLAVHDKCVGHIAGHVFKPCRQRFHEGPCEAVVEGDDRHVELVALYHCRFGDGPERGGWNNGDLY